MDWLNPAGAHGLLHGRQPGLEPWVRVGGGAQTPQPEQVMKLPVVLRPSGASRGGVVLGQELLMELGRQDAQDLNRIIRVFVVHRLGRHAPIIPHPGQEYGGTLGEATGIALADRLQRHPAGWVASGGATR
jgi:hypothetical protein